MGVQGSPVLPLRGLPLDAGRPRRCPYAGQATLAAGAQADPATDFDVEGVEAVDQQGLGAGAVPRQRPQEPVTGYGRGMVGDDLWQELEQRYDVPPYVRAGTGAVRRESEGGPIAQAAVHPGDAVVAGPAKPFHGLQRAQGEDPVVGTRVGRDRRFQIVVFGRDKHVQLVGGVDRLTVVKLRVQGANGGLHEGRLCSVVDDKVPGVAVGMTWRQPSKQFGPFLCAGRRLAYRGPFHCHRTELDKEGMPRVALMGPQPRERGDRVGHQLRVGFRQRDRQTLAICPFDPYQWFFEQVQHGDRPRTP